MGDAPPKALAAGLGLMQAQSLRKFDSLCLSA
jgi:hypothetical protein